MNIFQKIRSDMINICIIYRKLIINSLINQFNILLMYLLGISLSNCLNSMLRLLGILMANWIRNLGIMLAKYFGGCAKLQMSTLKLQSAYYRYYPKTQWSTSTTSPNCCLEQKTHSYPTKPNNTDSYQVKHT